MFEIFPHASKTGIAGCPGIGLRSGSEGGCSIEFFLNGERIEAATCPPQTTLLEFLRARGLTGSKDGCAEGECGACAVVLVCDNAYRAVNSCLMWLPMAAGREVWTIEGISREGMTEPQRALAEAGGSQCGYCTPGFAMSLFAEFYRPDRTSACDPLSMGGNLCRCTGYRPIRDAALSLGAAPDDGFRRLLSKPMAALPATKTEGWARPDTLRGVLEELAVPGAVAVAGATDLAVESNLKYRRWPHLVSLEAAPELREFADAGASVEIGAALTLAELERLWRTAPAAWHEWLELFASPLVRNRATLGGNLATASPVGDGAPLLLALDARLRLAGPGGECDVPLHEFFTGYRTTVLRPGEIIRSVIVPKPFPRRIEFHKVAKRRLDDISTVAAAFAQLNDGSVRLAFGGMAATPVRVRPAEELLASRGWGAEAVRQARQIIAEEMKPLSDHRGSADYRRAVAANLLTKFALHEASA